MKRSTTALIFAVISVLGFTNCQNKKAADEKTGTVQQIDSINKQVSDQLNDVKNVKQKNALSFNAYSFAENLKNDSFFESDNTDKEIELKDVGVTSYMISGNEVSLSAVFYDHVRNLAIPRFNNRPPGRAFVPEYFDKLEIKYDEEYKRTYSAALRIELKNPKDVKKLKMYISSEPMRNFEYQVEGTADEYRSGFIDLITIKGTFKGISVAGSYPNNIYEITNAELE
jgi:hypothetical protein